MARISKRLLAAFLTILMLSTVVLSAPLSVSAAISYSYPNTHTNTGDGAYDMVQIAKTQVGYVENSSGTKYGEWYYPGFETQPWCQMFVGWCSKEAGFYGSVIPETASCTTAVNWFKSMGLWKNSSYYGGNYTPKAGDIVYYNWSYTNASSDHVGIVVGVNGNYLHVIEGNTYSDPARVYEYTANSARTLTSGMVIGYGTPNYQKATHFTLKFYANGGEGTMANQDIEFGESTKISKNKFTREGYEFGGWRAYQEATGRWRFTNGTDTGWYTKEDKPAGYYYYLYRDEQSVSKTGQGHGDTVRMYAAWTKQDYTVKYFANGGTGTMEDSQHTYGIYSCLSPNKFTREGYDFAGWLMYRPVNENYLYSNDEESTGYLPGQQPAGYRLSIYEDQQMISTVCTTKFDEVHVIAQWVPKSTGTTTYYIEYNANGGKGTMENTAVVYGTSTKTRENAFTHDVGTFAGWHAYRRHDQKWVFKDVSTGSDKWLTWSEYEAAGGESAYTLKVYKSGASVSKTTSVDCDVVTFYAIWDTPQYFYFKYYPNGGTGTMEDQLVYYGTDTAIAECTYTREGYTFAGWYAYRTETKEWRYTNGTTNKFYVEGEQPAGYYYYVYRSGQVVSATGKGTGDVVSMHAVWVKNDYTVSYDANGGTGTMADTTHTYGMQSIISANTFTKGNDTFAGWYVYLPNSGKYLYSNGEKTGYYLPGTQPDGYRVELLADSTIVENFGDNETAVKLIAQWVPATTGTTTYYVDYNANGGTGTMDRTAVVYGTSTTTTANKFTREGYTFKGWHAHRRKDHKWLFEDSAGTKVWLTWEEYSAAEDGAYKFHLYENEVKLSKSTSLDGDIVTLYAIWEGSVYNVSFNTNGGTAVASAEVAYGGKVSKPANPTKTDYEFKGWYSDSALTKEYNFDTPVTSELTLYAAWTEVVQEQYYIRGSFNEWTTENPMTHQGSGIWTATLALNAGYYEFKAANEDYSMEWPLGVNQSMTLEKNSMVTFTLDTVNHTLTVELEEITVEYTVKFVDFNGTVLKTQMVAEGAAATPPADPIRANDVTYVYTFAGWNKAFDNITSNTTITAKYTQTPQIYYIRGAFNNWSTSNVMSSNGDGTYTAVVNLKAGTYEYKAANADYSMEWPMGPSNLSLTLDKESTVTFVLDTNVHSVTANVSEIVNSFTVTFADYDGTVLSTQTVEKGEAAVAPTAPTREGYNFTGWDKPFDNITYNITVTAKYSKIIETPTEGTLKIEVIGGTGFTMSTNDGATRPQSVYYFNSKAALGSKITVTAQDTTGNDFIGWINAANNQILTTNTAYTFYTGGNDYFKALYVTDLADVNMVMYKNDKSNQILDMQYYMPGDEITTPDDPSYVGYDFAGWELSVDEIKALINAAKDAEVNPVWTVKLVYVTVSVNGGEITGHGGMNESGQYLANRGMIATADAAASGKKFAYWVDGAGKIKSYEEEYKFWPATDTELTAVYVAENQSIDYNTFVYMDSCDTSGTYGTFNFSWFVPESKGYTFMASGLVAVNKDFYNENTFYHGTTDTNVWDRSAANATASGVYNWTGPVMSGQTWVAKAWVQYKDAEGNVQTVYSDMLEVVKY